MHNSLKIKDVSHLSHPFRLSLPRARVYARIGRLSGAGVTGVTHAFVMIFGPRSLRIENASGCKMDLSQLWVLPPAGAMRGPLSPHVSRFTNFSESGNLRDAR